MEGVTEWIYWPCYLELGWNQKLYWNEDNYFPVFYYMVYISVIELLAPFLFWIILLLSLSVFKTKNTKLEVLEIYFYSPEKADKKIYLPFQISSLNESIPLRSPETYKIISAGYKMGRF